MIPNLLSAASALLLWCSLETSAAPTDSPSPAGLTIPLRMRAPPSTRNLTELGLRAKAQRDAVIVKYSGQPSLAKRSTGYNLYVFPLSALCRSLASISVLTACLV